MDTLPPFRTDAGEALIVFRFFTHTAILAGSGAARCEKDLTVVT